MVTSVTSLGRNGVYDWLIQRLSAVILGVYTIGLIGYLVFNAGLDYETWKACMTSVPVQIANTLVIFAVAGHAWVGLWTITTDYLTRTQFGNAATAVRLLAQAVLALLILVYLLWGLLIVWGGA